MTDQQISDDSDFVVDSSGGRCQIKSVRKDPMTNQVSNDTDSVKTPWEIAVDWYGEREIAHSIQMSRSLRDPDSSWRQIPTDVVSEEFANWLTYQYRLAMAKGVEVARREHPVCETCHHQATVEGCPNCLAEEVARLRGAIRHLHDATVVLRRGMGGHTHWDATMQHGAGCEVCKQQREARKEADRLIEMASQGGG